MTPTMKLVQNLQDRCDALLQNETGRNATCDTLNHFSCGSLPMLKVFLNDFACFVFAG